MVVLPRYARRTQERPRGNINAGSLAHHLSRVVYHVLHLNPLEFHGNACGPPGAQTSDPVVLLSRGKGAPIGPAASGPHRGPAESGPKVSCRGCNLRNRRSKGSAPARTELVYGPWFRGLHLRRFPLRHCVARGGAWWRPLGAPRSAFPTPIPDGPFPQRPQPRANSTLNNRTSLPSNLC